MPRGFHPSPQLFRIPEDAHADEEIDEDFSVGQQLAAGFSPVVWVAILRDDCILVDIGEEDVPQNVIETAQGLLWEQEGKTEGWMEHCTDVLWKGLRYTESPFSFACVYNSRQLSNLECQNWIMEQVRWTATMRDADPVWRNGEYHACQTLFAPLLQERLQSSGDVSSIRQTAEDKYDSFEPPMDSAASRLSLANPFGDKFDEEERENLEPSDEDDKDLKEAVESEQKTIIGNLFRNKGVPNTEGQKKSVQQQKNQSTYQYVPTTPPRQASGSPIRSKPSPPCNGSPPKATEELVRRLARKQAELDRRRQEERENRLSPRRQVQRYPDTQQDSDAAVKPGDIGSDVDSGSMTSATADDEEELGSSNADNPGDDAPWKCWFLPSLPHAKPGPLAP